jgi:hypothetical protein
VLQVEIAGDDECDVLSVTGDVHLAGTIEVTFLDGAHGCGSALLVVVGEGFEIAEGMSRLVISIILFPGRYRRLLEG